MNLISISDLNRPAIEHIIELASGSVLKMASMKQKILATIFFEPSTRTRLSFESAFLMLGGQILSVENAFDNSSDKKGETFQDTIKTISQYVDFIVFRHPLTGSARDLADIVDCSLINAGDGSGEHPTQALVDLYTIFKEKGTIDGLKVLIIGDLHRARTINSFKLALSNFKVEIKEHEVRLGDYRHSDYRSAMIDVKKELIEKDLIDADVVYMTRFQSERYAAEITPRTPVYYTLNPDILKKDAIVLHPLPRGPELPVSADNDPRVCHWKQVRNGICVRQAVITALAV